MNRRKFLSRIAKAAVVFSVAPGVFKALPSAKNLKAVVVEPAKVVPFWYQTSRRSRCVEEAYAEFFRKLNSEEQPIFVSFNPEPLTEFEKWALNLPNTISPISQLRSS